MATKGTEERTKAMEDVTESLIIRLLIRCYIESIKDKEIKRWQQ